MTNEETLNAFLLMVKKECSECSVDVLDTLLRVAILGRQSPKVAAKTFLMYPGPDSPGSVPAAMFSAMTLGMLLVGNDKPGFVMPLIVAAEE